MILKILLLVCVIACHSVRADELVLKNGDRLTGTVKEMAGGVLQFKTGYAGMIKISWDQVIRITADKSLHIRVGDGAIIQATGLERGQDGFLVYKRPDSHCRIVSIAAVNPPAWETGEAYKLAGRVDAALALNRGNSDQDELDFNGDLEWRYRYYRARLFGELEYDTSDGKETKNKWQIFNKYDRFIAERRYYGFGLSMERDRLADLDLRTSVGPYVGWELLSGKVSNLDIEFGANYVVDEFADAEDNRYSALGWAVDYDRYLLPTVLQFYHRQNGLARTNAFDELNLDTWTGLRFPLSGGISASAEIKADYDGAAPRSVDKWDTAYRLKMGYQW